MLSLLFAEHSGFRVQKGPWLLVIQFDSLGSHMGPPWGINYWQTANFA